MGFAAVALLASLALASVALAAPVTRVTAHNALEPQVLVQINAVRAKHRLYPLRLSRPLSVAADAHSRAMAQRGFFKHESADGGSFWERVQRYYGSKGYEYWSVGENLLWSSGELDAAAALDMWMKSPGHRKNILTNRWREIGISAVRAAGAPGVFAGSDVTIVTTDFGVRR